MVIPPYIRFWLLLAPIIPSIPVAIFNLYHLLSSRALRTHPSNHFVILLLSCALIEIVNCLTWNTFYLRNGAVLSPTPAFCYIWVFLDSTVVASSYLLMAWASIERHILVFHQNWIATKAKRFYFHYLPLATCIIWPATFYCITLLIIPCDVPFNYSRKVCSRYLCITTNSRISLFDAIAHYIMPAFVTVSFSTALFIRVLYRRYRARGRIDWRNYKKLTLQLLPMSVLYLCLQLPPMTLYAAYSSGLSTSVASSYYSDANFFMNWIILFTPFASVITLPELKTKLKNLFCFWRGRHAVQPEMIEMARRNVGQTVAVVQRVAVVQSVAVVQQVADVQPVAVVQ